MSTTDLLLEGLSPGDVSEAFLLDLMAFIEMQGYSVGGISVIRTDRWEDTG